MAVQIPKISNISACKALRNQHEIRIAFFERDNTRHTIQVTLRAWGAYGFTTGGRNAGQGGGGGGGGSS